jgi:hypothetical protein
MRKGWALPDYSEMEYWQTYFAVINDARSHLIRPCIIPGEATPLPGDHLSLRQSLTLHSERERLSAINDYLQALCVSSGTEEWTELTTALRRFSPIHPDGVDLVKCLIEHPRVLAKLWFYSIGDSEVRGYLNKFTETSPFNWWMINPHDWVLAADSWRDTEVLPIGNEELIKLSYHRALSEINQLVEEEAELNAVGDLLRERFDEELSTDTAIGGARKHVFLATWAQLDALARMRFINEIGDATWPQVNQVWGLQRKLPESIFELIDWPASDFTFQRSVIQSGVIAAAALHCQIVLSEDDRIALLAARNFHPSAFATNFRAAQAALWVYDET